MDKLTIGLLIVCTGKYGRFLQNLIDTLSTHFFVDDEVVIYLFWDQQTYHLLLPARFSIVCIPTEHKPFPFPTLYRYKFFVNASEKIHCQYLFYSDVDMILVGDVGREILPGENDGGLVATGHPGFWKGGGSWCTNPNSTAFTEERFWIRYVCGGFQGGERNAYLTACGEMASNIATDEGRGIIVEWNDEMHWNKYVCTRKYKLLTPEYCMIPEQDIREKYKIAHFVPRIIALTKDHDELRRDGNSPA